MQFAISIREFFGTKEIIVGIVSLIGTLFATFVGAWIAFQFARYQRKKERFDSEVAAGNRALFTLTTMYNQTFQHQEEIVADYRDRGDAWLNLPATEPLNENLSFEIRDLSFLLQNAAPVFQKVLLEEARFKLLARMIAAHRSLILATVWPRLEAGGINMVQQRPESEVMGILGPGIVKQLKVTSDGIIKNCDENVASLTTAFVDLRKALKQLYPDRRFIDFKFKEPAAP